VQRLVKLARFAWRRWPKVVVHLPARFKFPLLLNEVTELVRSDPLSVQDSPHALALFIDEEIPAESRSKLRVSPLRVGRLSLLVRFLRH